MRVCTGICHNKIYHRKFTSLFQFMKYRWYCSHSAYSQEPASNKPESDAIIKKVINDKDQIVVHRCPTKSSIEVKNAVTQQTTCRSNSASTTLPNEQLPATSTRTDDISLIINQNLWSPVIFDKKKLLKHYLMLTKIRLTGLVVLTTMGGYAMAPGDFMLSTFAFCTIGTALVSASANSINQFLEVPYDSQMNRTRNRVLVRGLLSPLHCVTFASISALSGLLLLYVTCNPLITLLAGFNLLLYTAVYTPLKRLSILNTWIGSLVGAIPPLMGWAAATATLDPAALLMGAILYSWQFPHFNALSWNLRGDYSQAGYRMMSVLEPELCKRVALRHSIALTIMCLLAPSLNLTSCVFAVDSLPVNLYLIFLANKFRRDGDSSSSRKLFRYTLVHIPLLILLMLISKKSKI